MRPSTTLLCLLLALAAPVAGVIPAQTKQEARAELPPLPYFDNAWRPNPTMVLATLDGQPINESELLTHLVIEGKDASILRNWQTASARRAPAQHRALREAILSRARLRLLADAAVAEDAPDADLVDKGARMRAYPAAMLVYADLIARPTVEIQILDVAYSYEQKGSSFLKPDAYVVRELRVPIVQPASEATRRQARRRAAELREEAVAGAGLAPLLNAYPQYRVLQEPEATQRLEVGTAAMAPFVLEQLRQMSVGQISQPVPTSGAFSLYEIVRDERGQTTPINDVASSLRTDLRQQILKVRTESLVQELVEERYPVVYTDVYPYAEDESVIMRIGNFTATYGELLAIFPELPTEPIPPQTRYDVPEGVREFLRALRHGELLTQELERAQLTNEYTYQAGLRMGRDRVLADIHRERMLVDEEPTEEEILEWIVENRDRLAPPARRGVWQLNIIPENWDVMSMEAQQDLEIEMLGVLEEVVRTAEQLLSERAAISGQRVLSEPAVILNRLLRSDPGRYRMSVDSLGQKTEKEAQEELGVDINALSVGRFGEIGERRDGVLATLYAGGAIEQPVPLDEQLVELARVEMMNERVFAAVEEELAGLESSGRLRFLLPTD